MEAVQQSKASADDFLPARTEGAYMMGSIDFGFGTVNEIGKGDLLLWRLSP